MTPHLLGEELKRFRESKRMTLQDISSMTRISVSILEAIEAGKFDVLPAAYVRAIIREYAEHVGLEVSEVIKKYDSVRGSHRPPPEEKVQPSPPAKPFRSVGEIASLLKGARHKLLKENVVLVALVVLAAGLSYILLRQGSDQPVDSAVSEIPFDRVIHENEAASGARALPAAPVAVAGPKRPDSLLLQLEATDSVWISVTMDGKRSEEYLFPPGWSRSWKAEKEFVITMGNAGGATFRLNDQDLGVLGRKGAVVRSVKITEDGIRR